MSYHFRYQSIINLKENEKNQVMTEYEKSVEDFEKVAQKLYECLKKKEDLEKAKAEKLDKGLSVQEMRHYQQFVTNLEKTIEHYQKLVTLARNKMHEKQQLLMNKNIELKKYEKIKENDFEKYKEQQKNDERRELDQVAIMTYSYKGN